jgi:ATP-dependent RNA helicase DDX27
MADLLPTLASDDEENAIIKVEDDDNEDDDSMCMDESFTLVGNYKNDLSSARNIQSSTISGWSFNTALNASSANDGDQNTDQIPPRMDIDAIIAAKRKDLLRAEKIHQDKNSANIDLAEDDNDNGDDRASESDSDTDDDEDDGDSENRNLNDERLHHFDEDVLTTRYTKGQKKKNSIDTMNMVDDQISKNTSNKNVEGDISEEEDDNFDNGDGDDDEIDDDESQQEAAKANAFYDTETSMAVSQQQHTGSGKDTSSDSASIIKVFNQLPLCRPLLRGIAAMGFVQPTPIQSAVIPLVLNGRDICASAVTGSGKTAAFVLPIAERIIHRTSYNSYNAMHITRALILTPTRELAAQCYSMMSTFIQFTKLRAVLIVGGTKNVTSQASDLRTRPDFIIATPGRLLDHITNSVGCALDDIEFLILDEADRLLDLGFSDEIMEIVKSCPIHRQTLLFSATMNTKVDDLIRLSLKNPVRVRISDQQHNNISTSSNDTNIEVAPRLEQEFIRIRASNEGINREGILLALLTRTYKTQVICFFDTKVTAHRIMIMAGLCGIRCAELHGNLTQPQRLAALEDFRCGNVDVLLATDLAARGLDIDRVQTVINFEMPSQLATYIHRIGRTARAGRSGRSCTLIGEGRRYLMKELMKESSNKNKPKIDGNSVSINQIETRVIRSRTIPAAVIAHFAAKLQGLELHYEEVLQAESVAKLDRIAEMEVTRAQNLIEHADEIKNRPQKEWFASKADKQRSVINSLNAKHEIESKIATNKRGVTEKPLSGMHRMTRKKRRTRELREAMEQGDDNLESSHQPVSKLNELKIKSDVRKQKRIQAEMKHGKLDASIHDLDIHEEKKLQKKVMKKVKKMSSENAVGDGNLFEEEQTTFSTKSKLIHAELKDDTPLKSSYKFIGYNPDKKLGRKRSHNSFKSKSKYKRR